MNTSSASPASLARSGLLLLLLTLYFFFHPDDNLLFEFLALLILTGYHLYTDRRFSSEQLRSSGLIGLHIGIYLLLCTLVVWMTTGEEESIFWILYLLPIAVAASHLGLRSTLLTCTASGGLLWLLMPARFYLDPEMRQEEVPEMLVFILTLFLVGVLIQLFSDQSRRQLQRERDLNSQLVLRQEELQNSLQQLKSARETLRRKEQLAALGEMAAGMAHEIRNPLGIISSSAQLLKGKVAPEGKGGDLLEIIEEESGRLNRLVTDFLTFGRPAEPKLQLCDLRDVVRHSVQQVGEMAASRGVQLGSELPSEMPRVQADPEMLGQVLLNLLLNALEATPPGGRIDLKVSASHEYCRIEVRDTGCGVPQADRSRVFTPFFTTREHGTGLGLSNAFRMVESHGGELRLEDSGPHGTRFVICLPGKEN